MKDGEVEKHFVQQVKVGVVLNAERRCCALFPVILT